jgi:hypothetical protein
VICKNGGADISKATTIFLFWGSLGFQNLPQSKYFFLMRRKAEKIPQNKKMVVALLISAPPFLHITLLVSQMCHADLF